MTWRRLRVMPQGELNVVRNDTTHHPDINAGRRDTRLAAQQIVGIWAERWPRSDFADRDHLVVDGSFVIVSKRVTHA